MEEQSFVVSARKYRPESWDSVVGQQAITSTLANAISSNQLATGYLFCGPRGVGKTSCARIFAREVNKEHTTEDDDFAYNIFELDAASNNKVEHIRSLIDQVRVPPQRGKYKVYIIDEVHMLTTQAFNAFLKTLEEPPAHAIFILATTEKHKIIPTILSRCQIFDFRRIGVEDIAGHLKHIAQKEGIQAEDEALHVIAQKADGALRDALSIFDQLASFTGRNLSYQAVIDNLNVLDHQVYFKVVDDILNEDVKSTLIKLDEVISRGFDPHHFVEGLGEHFRNIMMAKNPETVYLMELAEQVKEKMVEQAEKCDIFMIVKALEFINECDQHYRMSMNQRMTVELLLMQLCSIPQNLREKKNDQFELIAPLGMELKEEPAKAQTEAAAPMRSVKRGPQRMDKPAGLKTRNKPKSNEGYSLTQMLAETEVSLPGQNVVVEVTSEEKSFSKEELLEAFKACAQELREEHGENVYHILTSEDPLLVNNTEVKLRLFNSTQILAIDAVRQEVVDRLRQKLRNRLITLETVFEKGEGPEQIAKLPSADKDVYDAMVEKNPNLDELRKLLKLDFED